MPPRCCSRACPSYRPSPSSALTLTARFVWPSPLLLHLTLTCTCAYTRTHPHPHPHPSRISRLPDRFSLEGCKLLTNAALPIAPHAPNASTSPCPLMTKDPISHAPLPESIVGSTMMAQGDVVARSSISPASHAVSCQLLFALGTLALGPRRTLCHSLLRLNCSGSTALQMNAFMAR